MSEGRRGVAELSLAQLPQVLAWHELECAPSPAQSLAKLDSEEPRAENACSQLYIWMRSLQKGGAMCECVHRCVERYVGASMKGREFGLI